VICAVRNFALVPNYRHEQALSPNPEAVYHGRLSVGLRHRDRPEPGVLGTSSSEDAEAALPVRIRFTTIPCHGFPVRLGIPSEFSAAANSG
jgi:hypothetical protein